MITKNKKWHKTCVFNNCEVVGFNRFHDLTPDMYGKKNYCLSILIDKKEGENLLIEINEVLAKAEREYQCDIRRFNRITERIDRKEYCPKGKLVLDLSTDSKGGMHLIRIFNEDNKPVTRQFTLPEGSFVSVCFDLILYKTSAIGISIKLKDIQINSNDIKSDISYQTSPFKNKTAFSKGFEDNSEDEFIDYEDFDEEDEEL